MNFFLRLGIAARTALLRLGPVLDRAVVQRVKGIFVGNGTKPTIWVSAWNWLAKADAWVKDHPYLSTAIFTVATFTPELADKVVAYWDKATGGKVTSPEEAIKYAEQSPEKEAVILSGFAAAGVHPEVFMQGKELSAHDQQLLANLQQLYADRQSALDRAALIHGVVDGAGEAGLIANIRVINGVSDIFGARSSEAIRSMHQTLRAFVAMDVEAVEEVLTVRGALR